MHHPLLDYPEQDWPPHLRVEEALAEETKLPAEVLTSLADLGLPVIRQAAKIKQSFHETFVVEFEALVTDVDTGPHGDPQRAVVQVLGAQVGDSSLFSLETQISADSIVRAHELAREAGVFVPHIWATGTVSTRGPFEQLPFVVYEYISTDTVEDEIQAPNEEWDRIVECQVERLLAVRALDEADTSPLPRIPDIFGFLAELRGMARDAEDEPLWTALERLESTFRDELEVIPGPLTLVHQDLNAGNVLCSRGRGGWRLDAVIDWESAVVADSRLLSNEEPWVIGRHFGRVTLARWLCRMARTRVEHAPRCNLAELLENHDESERVLRHKQWLDG